MLRLGRGGGRGAPEEVERQVAEALAFLRRRCGDYASTSSGSTRTSPSTSTCPLLRPLYRPWFRVEVRGIENIPADGGALVVANHSGTIAMDSLMTQVAVHDEHPAHRPPADARRRPGLPDSVHRHMARKPARPWPPTPTPSGCCPAASSSASGPRASRASASRSASATSCSASAGAASSPPPCAPGRRSSRARSSAPRRSTRSSATCKTVARLLGLPYAPITPTFPLLGPLGLIPLPSKWIIEFGAPVETADLARARPTTRCSSSTSPTRCARRSSRRSTRC